MDQFKVLVLSCFFSDNFYDFFRDFFGLDKSFSPDYLVSNGEKIHKIYITTEWGSRIMSDINNRLKTKSVGVRAFEKLNNAQGSKCVYRATQDGVHTIYPFLGPNRLVVIDSKDDLMILLKEKDPLFERFSSIVSEKLKSMDVGSLIYSYKFEVSLNTSKQHILMVGWRGNFSTHILLKNDHIENIIETLNNQI